MISVCMPQVGENLTLGVVLEWLKDVGDPVARGDVIAIVESEKAAFEVTAERAGVLLRIDCPAGREAQVLKPIAWIGEPGEVVPAALEDPPETTAPLQNEPIAAWHPRSVDLRGMSTAATFTSPSARRLARQLLVDLAAVWGSGPSGRIVRRDALAAACFAFLETRAALDLAGWSDEDIVDIVHQTAMYNYMVHIADGLGVELHQNMLDAEQRDQAAVDTRIWGERTSAPIRFPRAPDRAVPGHGQCRHGYEARPRPSPPF